MALRFNPPPNWPAPPEGFEPPAGWQPDPAWGPAPEGWQIWIDDSAPSSGSAASAAGAATGADPAWAPTQAVSTAPTGPSAPVADPTGMSASAPSGDYAGQAPVGGASPYTANMDYAQSPTPFQGQGAPGGPQPPVGGWQPAGFSGQEAPGGGSKPVTQQWWFWTGAAALVVILVVGGIFLFRNGSDKGDPVATGTTTSQPKNTGKPGGGGQKDPKPEKTGGTGKSPDGSAAPSSANGPGTKDDPFDPTAGAVQVKAGKYGSDPNASVDVTFKPVEWDVSTETVKDGDRTSIYKEPPAGKTYIRVPVDITYHGNGQMGSTDLKVVYSYNGTTSEEASNMFDKNALQAQSMPRDGGTASGYLVFIVDSATQNDGNAVFVLSLGYSGGEEVFVKAQ